MDEDIIPVGRFETVPIEHLRSAEAHDYPDVAVIKPIPNVDELLEEAKRHVDIIGKRFLRDRTPYLDARISMDDLKAYLSEIGFGKDQYQSYSLRKLGTNELEDFIEPHTRKFFEDLGVPCFRQQHTISSNGWKTKIHRDHANFKVHGFRGMVPLSAPVYLGYIGPKGENLIYCLEPGHLYFANIAKPHRGFAIEQDRLAIMFQMASDRLVVDEGSQALKPLTSHDSIPAHLIPYEIDSGQL